MMHVLAVLLFLLPGVALAGDRIPSHCLAVAGDIAGAVFVERASFPVPDAADRVAITYVDHSTFVLTTPGGISVATDYTGFVGQPGFVPTVVTMNIAHESHYTAFPAPGIEHVLEGWPGPDGTPRRHDIDLGEMLIRNVTTDIRARGGGGVFRDGNSIFIFEVAGLCIGHLGHLHHEPDAAQYAAIGRLDVVMAPVDGGLTLDRATLVRVLGRLRSRIVLPMHWFGDFTLARFLGDMEGDFTVIRDAGSSLVLSRDHLPSEPTVMVLYPASFRPREE